MVCLNDHRIGLLAEVVRSESEGSQFVVGVHRIVDEHDRSARLKGSHGGKDTRECGLFHTSAIGSAKHHDSGTRQVAIHAFEHTHGVLRHRRIGLTCRTHHRGRGVVPEVHPRVDRDAVPTHRDSRQVDVAERLAVTCGDDREHVDAVIGGESRELIGQADVHVAVCGLREFGELGSLSASQIPDPIGAVEVGSLIELEHRFVESNRALGAFVVDAADELGVLAKISEDAACEHALGREGEEEVATRNEARAGFEHRQEAIAGRADGQGGLVRHEGSRLESAGDVARGRVHPAEVRDTISVDEQGNNHHDGLARRHRSGGIGGGPQEPRRHHLTELLSQVSLAGEWLDSGVDLVDSGGVHVGAENVVAEGSELDCEREADLAEGHHRDVHKNALGSGTAGTVMLPGVGGSARQAQARAQHTTSRLDSPLSESKEKSCASCRSSAPARNS
ncbi:unannotated protein [freshwater metagenome]|uniref:Unannotated protein n=1 Tax=freshwater metagenome TaxID=449393 RepID=A0A6J7KRS4_9ZZZZ